MKSSSMTKLQVGITSLIALAILFGGTLWVRRYNPMIRTMMLSVVFRDGRSIGIGDPVNVSGVKVGEIKNVKLDSDNNVIIMFTMKQNIILHPDCSFTIRDVGLMGDKVLVVNPGTETGTVDTSQILEGTEGTDLNDLINSANELVKRLQKISTMIDTDLNLVRLSTTLEQTLKNIQQAAAVYEEFARENREPLYKSLKSFEASSNELRMFIRNNDERLESIIASFQRTSDKIANTLDNIDNLSTIVDTMSVYMKTGNGTLAKLVKTDEFYEELRMTNAHIDSFITDFKSNPGKYTKDMKFKLRLF
jgi:phospholipid/cholesterol/gamma-HCH transport system substrate-binding protein